MLGELPQVALGSALLFLDEQGLFSLAAPDARLARECFGPGERELLERRIGELVASRAAVARAVDSERRRVERDRTRAYGSSVSSRSRCCSAVAPARVTPWRTPAGAGVQAVRGDAGRTARGGRARLPDGARRSGTAGGAERCALPFRVV
nr:hypothetical protein OG461_08605 [Streptomyces sp. NBC_00995]